VAPRGTKEWDRWISGLHQGVRPEIDLLAEDREDALLWQCRAVCDGSFNNIGVPVLFTPEYLAPANLALVRTRGYIGDLILKLCNDAIDGAIEEEAEGHMFDLNAEWHWGDRERPDRVIICWRGSWHRIWQAVVRWQERAAAPRLEKERKRNERLIRLKRQLNNKDDDDTYKRLIC
jgi:hypothetical protein